MSDLTPFDRLQRAQSPTVDDASKASLLTRFATFRRGPWENLATVFIMLGVVMLMQPFFLGLFTASFATTLIGTVGFIIVSHFPE